MDFYSRPELRARYQAMLDAQDEAIDRASAPGRMLQEIVDFRPARIIEVGCGNGRLYRQLVSERWSGSYMGIEPGGSLIETNRPRHPEARWEAASSYAIPAPDSWADVVFSVYVLEHLVFPLRALEEMLRVLAPEGRLFIVFPDFVSTGRFGSQLLGFSPGNARSKLCRGRVWDAVVGLFDSRWRLPRALRAANQTVGPFPVNLAPLCLDWSHFMDADVDAVYVASKREIDHWARARALGVSYPAGIDCHFAEHVFISVSKPSMR